MVEMGLMDLMAVLALPVVMVVLAMSVRVA